MLHYLIENGDSGYTHTESKDIKEWLDTFAKEYFEENPSEVEVKLCLVDFNFNKSTVYYIQRELKFTFTAY